MTGNYKTIREKPVRPPVERYAKGDWDYAQAPVNAEPFTGFPPGTVRFKGAKVSRPPWWRRAWDRLMGRESPWVITYRFEA